METLAKGMKSPPAKPDMFFILGLFSLLDALLGQPMADLLHELPLAPEIAQALLGERSVIRAFLELAEDLEDADWKAAQDMLHELDLPLRTASALHQDSLRFAGELVQDLHTKPHKA
jgi:EAL and modified HD-GYP domain-containing signal transduction protein